MKLPYRAMNELMLRGDGAVELCDLARPGEIR